MFDPLALTNEIRKQVTRSKDSGEERVYFRFRGGRWYGGIATADCIGCNLRCVFCWSWYFRDNAIIGRFYTPHEVYERLMNILRRRGYKQVRISGGEPTLSKNHLLKVIELFDSEGVLFILETNGILLGQDRTYARELSKFDNLHVRVSIKGTTPREFSRLTGAIPSAFFLQLKALKNLLDEGVSVHPAVMLSFSRKEDIREFIKTLKQIDEILIEELEEEYVFLYPHVVKRLRNAGVWPKRAFYPSNIPKELI